MAVDPSLKFVCVRMRVELAAKLKEIADRREVSVSVVVRDAVRLFVNQTEHAA